MLLDDFMTFTHWSMYECVVLWRVVRRKLIQSTRSRMIGNAGGACELGMTCNRAGQRKAGKGLKIVVEGDAGVLAALFRRRASNTLGAGSGARRTGGR